MIHRLTLGFFYEEKILRRDYSVEKPIAEHDIADILEKYRGSLGCVPSMLDGEPVFRGGYLVCPWYSPCFHRNSVKMAIEIIERLGCLAVDVEHGRIIEVSYLKELIDRSNAH